MPQHTEGGGGLSLTGFALMMLALGVVSGFVVTESSDGHRKLAEMVRAQNVERVERTLAWEQGCAEAKGAIIGTSPRVCVPKGVVLSVEGQQ